MGRGRRAGRATHLVIAPLTLFVVLYRLDLVDAAGRGQRGGAWRSPLCVVAAAVLVYDLGAHFGDALARRVVAQRRAPAVRAWRGRRRGAVWTRKAGLGHDALIGCAVVEARNSTEQTQTEAAVAGVFSGGVWPKGGRQADEEAVGAVVAVGGSTVLCAALACSTQGVARSRLEICAGGSGLSVQKG